MKTSPFTRRGFLKAAAVSAAPLFIPASALGRDGRPAPSERIVMGCIGLGGMGTGDMQGFLAKAGTQVVAVCDVDRSHRLEARGVVEKHYGGGATSGSWKGCQDYNDFRDLLARDDIDAVTVTTPDHWHALISIAAANAGKDIYCEKPLTLTIAEGKAVRDTVERMGTVFQTGSQLRSTWGVRRACELVRNGRIGEVHTIKTGCGVGPTSTSPDPEMPIPPGFDYDMWLGPAPWAPYTVNRCHWNFRWILDYSDGEITDLGAHDNDIAQWGNGTERTGPVEIEGRGEFPRDGLWNAPPRFRVVYTYANGVKLICSPEYRAGATFEGTEGWIWTRGAIEGEPASMLESRIGANEIRLYESDDHHQNFLDCIRTRKETIAPPAISHRSVSVCHLGTIAMRLERKLRWNPDEERFVNDPEADAMLSRAMRAPWKI